MTAAIDVPANSSLEFRLHDAIRRHGLGRHDESERQYRTCLVEQPSFRDAVYLFGRLALDRGQREAAERWLTRAAAVDPMSGEAHIASAAASAGAGRSAKAYRHLRRALCLGPAASEAWNALIHLAWREGGLERAAGAMKRELAIKAAPATPRRSVVIPVIDGSPGSPYNIHTLLNDLATFDGEVVCVLNDATMFRDLSAHPRIDKFCFNSRNAGVGRAWNIGLNLAEGAFVFILNSDLHATPQALHRLETFLEETADAVIAGVMGEWFDPGNLLTTRRIEGDALQAPTEVDRASGYCFAVHAERFHSAGLCFDPRLGPFFYEETDIAIRARERRLKVYAVPVAGVDHRWGISQNPRPVTYFGRSVDRNHVLLRNAQLILQRGRR